MSTQETKHGTGQGAAPEHAERTWVEEIEVAGHELVGRVEKLLQDSRTKRVVIRTQDGRELMSVPLTFGVVAGGILTLGAPLLAALGAAAALVSKVKLEVIREADAPAPERPPEPDA